VVQGSWLANGEGGNKETGLITCGWKSSPTIKKVCGGRRGWKKRAGRTKKVGGGGLGREEGAKGKKKGRGGKKKKKKKRGKRKRIIRKGKEEKGGKRELVIQKVVVVKRKFRAMTAGCGVKKAGAIWCSRSVRVEKNQQNGWSVKFGKRGPGERLWGL